MRPDVPEVEGYQRYALNDKDGYIDVPCDELDDRRPTAEGPLGGGADAQIQV
jgi:hypothetical protein